MKAVTKSIEIDVWQITSGPISSGQGVPNWVIKAFNRQLLNVITKSDDDDTIVGYRVRSPDREMRGKLGDYLVRGRNGEMYMVPKFVFDMNYELVKGTAD